MKIRCRILAHAVGVLLIVLGVASVTVFALTTPAFVKPRISDSGTFLVLSHSQFHPWYEIVLGSVSNLPFDVTAKYVPSRSYTLGFIVAAQSYEECASLPGPLGLSLTIGITNTTLGSTEEFTAKQWKPSYLPLPTGFIERREERCTLYATEGQAFVFSKLYNYRIQVQSTGTFDERLHNARLVFVGQG